jgi:hypothetical protein
MAPVNQLPSTNAITKFTVKRAAIPFAEIVFENRYKLSEIKNPAARIETVPAICPKTPPNARALKMLNRLIRINMSRKILN